MYYIHLILLILLVFFSFIFPFLYNVQGHIQFDKDGIRSGTILYMYQNRFENGKIMQNNQNCMIENYYDIMYDIVMHIFAGINFQRDHTFFVGPYFVCNCNQ